MVFPNTAMIFLIPTGMSKRKSSHPIAATTALEMVTPYTPFKAKVVISLLAIVNVATVAVAPTRNVD